MKSRSSLVDPIHPNSSNGGAGVISYIVALSVSEGLLVQKKALTAVLLPSYGHTLTVSVYALRIMCLFSQSIRLSLLSLF